MIAWITANWLAFYGAVVGTIALIINVFRFRHLVNKEKIKLALSVGNHPERLENIKRLENTESRNEWERPNIVEAYEVTIRNTGSITAYIENAGVICDRGESHDALISEGRDTFMMNNISAVGQLKIEPKSSKKVSVYYCKDEEIFIAKKGFVIDSTGKKKTVKAALN